MMGDESLPEFKFPSQCTLEETTIDHRPDLVGMEHVINFNHDLSGHNGKKESTDIMISPMPQRESRIWHDHTSWKSDGGRWGSNRAVNVPIKVDRYQVKTTNPKKYYVRPSTGVVLPRSTCDIIVAMQAQKEAPPNMQCHDKFLLQSVRVDDGVTAKDVTAEMFSNEAGHVIEECKLRFLCVPASAPLSCSRRIGGGIFSSGICVG
ncbi:hypothetical protein MLD38_018400 [Melastoma candidum]|uniref:Uncharacterized protein n=1 Tax=Melastoma candidum TaxID=119954 RepID=A0ACB9QUT5_9MYRT|nr:hypothetical protein MLD38_018400 [Melastoma candidum]